MEHKRFFANNQPPKSSQGAHSKNLVRKTVLTVSFQSIRKKYSDLHILAVKEFSDDMLIFASPRIPLNVIYGIHIICCYQLYF